MVTKENLLRIIHNGANKVTEEYLKKGVDPNTTIVSLISTGDIENEEILARICEKANQNIYLSIFKNTKDRSKIIFPTANKEDFAEFFKGEESVYNNTPKDYKEGFDTKLASKAPSEFDKINQVNEIVSFRNKLAHFAKKIEGMCNDELVAQERYAKDFEKVANDIVMTGQSILDYSKLAGVVIESKTDLSPKPFHEKVASIVEDYQNRGITLKDNFTKLANSVPDPDSSLYKSPVKYVESMAKTAALADIGMAVLERVELLDLVLENESAKG